MLEIAVSTLMLWLLWPSLEALWARFRLIWERVLRPILRALRATLRVIWQRGFAPVFQLFRWVMSR